MSQAKVCEKTSLIGHRVDTEVRLNTGMEKRGRRPSTSHFLYKFRVLNNSGHHLLSQMHMQHLKSCDCVWVADKTVNQCKANLWSRDKHKRRLDLCRNAVDDSKIAL